MTEQPIDLKTTLRGLWRRRVLVGLLAFIGLLGGLSDAVISPANPRAATLVLLPPSAATSTGTLVRDMKTQIVVATSDPVLAAAGHGVNPPVSATSLKRDVSVKAVSEQVLQVEVVAPKARDAIALANAVATSYVHFVNQVLPGATDGGPAQIFQPAMNTLPASKLHTPVMGGIGFGAGLLIGLVLAAALSNRDRRLRSRDEISRAIGIPVLASLEATPCRSVVDWQKLLDQFMPSPAVAWSLRRLLHRLAPAGAQPQEIRVIAFGDDGAAVAAGAQLARVARTLGIFTALVPGEGEAMVLLRAACAIHDEQGQRPEELTVGRVTTDRDGRSWPPLSRDGQGVHEFNGPKPNGPALTVSLLAVDRRNPEVQPYGGANLISISAGFPTADDLARLALAASDAAQAIDGILVVNPEPKDATAGRASEGQFQQMISRASRSPAPEETARRTP